MTYITILAILLAIFAVAGITAIELTAIQHGIDGTALSASVAAIAGIITGIAGWLIPSPIKRRKP